MGSSIQLTTSDGHILDAYRAEPDGLAKGSVVVIQEIFGVNQHIRNLCEEYAKNGYVAIAPALFDRAEKGLDLGYGQDDFAKGRDGKVGIVGYCFGGFVSWLGACQCDGLSAASTFYGGGIHAKREDTPKIPIIFNFGDKDGGISLSQVHEIKEAHPDIPCYVYDDSGHGFCCDERESYNQGACERGHTRTLELFGQHLS